MSDKRLNNQLILAFPTEDKGEARRADEEVSNRLRRTAKSKARVSGFWDSLGVDSLTRRTAVYGPVRTVV
jgi:hypothetical protein